MRKQYAPVLAAAKMPTEIGLQKKHMKWDATTKTCSKGSGY